MFVTQYFSIEVISQSQVFDIDQKSFLGRLGTSDNPKINHLSAIICHIIWTYKKMKTSILENVY